MKTLIIIIISLVLFTVLGILSMDDPGVVTIARAPHRIELPLALAILLAVAAFAVLYLLFHYLFSLLAAPKKVKNWNAQRNDKNAQSATLRGYARLIEGDWAKGEKDLTGKLKHSKTPLLNYLGAAYAAQQNGNFDKRDDYLNQAEQADPAYRMAVDLTRARLMSQAGQLPESQALLEKMHGLAPGNTSVTRLLSDVYRRSENWDGLTALLPALGRRKVLPADQVAALEVMCKAGQMECLPDQSAGTASKEWRALSRAKKRQPAIAGLYARQFIAANNTAMAEKAIRLGLAKTWDTELAGLYGQVHTDNLWKQIDVATVWQADHENDANVQLTLARLYLAYGSTERAEEHYRRAITEGASEEAFYELGRYLEDNGKKEAALEMYKKGVQSSIALNQHSTAPAFPELGGPADDTVIALGADADMPSDALILADSGDARATGTKALQQGGEMVHEVAEVEVIEAGANKSTPSKA